MCIVKSLILGLLLFASLTASADRFPPSTANDDSCDIGVTPAATLLLPYDDRSRLPVHPMLLTPVPSLALNAGSAQPVVAAGSPSES